MVENSSGNKVTGKELRKISAEELKPVLEEHEKWLESNHKEGRRAVLRNTDLREANFTVTSLDRAILANVDLRGAKLYGVDLIRANINNSDLSGADLDGSDLSNAYLLGTNLANTRLTGAILTNAALIGSDLRNANLMGANLTGANVKDVKFNRNGRYRGIRVETCYGSPRFRRFAMDQDFLEELQESGKGGMFLYSLWNVLADCGRTPWRWMGWSILFAVYFGWLFFLMGEEAFEVAKLPFSFGTMLYYSVVTFTTLGFGDIIPKTTTAACWVMAEVILGYIMLGGLISILATLIARRS